MLVKFPTPSREPQAWCIPAQPGPHPFPAHAIHTQLAFLLNTICFVLLQTSANHHHHPIWEFSSSSCPHIVITPSVLVNEAFLLASVSSDVISPSLPYFTTQTDGPTSLRHSPISASAALELQALTAALSFERGCWRQNPGPRPCTESPLLTEPHPRLPLFSFASKELMSQGQEDLKAKQRTRLTLLASNLQGRKVAMGISTSTDAGRVSYVILKNNE